MKPIATFAALLTLNGISAAVSLDASAADSATNENPLRAGTNFIATRLFSAEEDQKVLKAFEGLRGADEIITAEPARGSLGEMTTHLRE